MVKPAFRSIFYLDYVFVLYTIESQFLNFLFALQMACKDRNQKRCPEFQVWRDNKAPTEITMCSHLRWLKVMWKYTLGSSWFHPIQVGLPQIECVSLNPPSVGLPTQHFEDLQGSVYDGVPLPMSAVEWGELVLIELRLEEMLQTSGHHHSPSPLAAHDCWGARVQLRYGGTDA